MTRAEAEQAAARALWQAGNDRIGFREWDTVKDHYLLEAGMHNPSDRPCSTCRKSAAALRLVGVEPFVDGAVIARAVAVADAARAALAELRRPLDQPDDTT